MKVGITGHQDLGSSEDVNWLSETLRTTIKQNNVKIGLTSLAIGADQLFAQIIQDFDIPYVAIIPCSRYEKTFKSKSNLDKYLALLQNASSIITLPFDSPSEMAFYEAGKQIVDTSDLLFAIWNGEAAKGLGGTGDIVKYAISTNRKVLHINPIRKNVTLL